MESIIDRIKSNRFWKFHGGIHPPEQKILSNDKPIKSTSLPEKLVLPLQQHIGAKGDILVSEGESVLKGQPLTSSDNPMMVPIHAPTSGTITKIGLHRLPHPSAMEDLSITLIPDGEDKWVERKPIDDVFSLSRDEILSKISQAGISGMGGAGFPTAMKLSTKPVINFLIINAAECEPYITCDDLLLREESAKVAKGIDILDHLLLPEFILIGIEDNKPEAIAAIKNATQHNDKIHVCVLPTRYPTGGEKQLIQILTGKEITHGSLPINHGIIMQNVATIFSIAEAVENDSPLIKRVVTVTGQNIEKPQNFWTLLGTPVEHLVKHAGFINEDNPRVIMGGPMMGFTMPELDIPIVKTSNCILAPSAKEIPHQQNEEECIRCGECAVVCPSSLLPQELQWHAKAKNFETLESLNLFDCIDCGACAYVCPSHIPLVQYYRVAKAQIKEQKALAAKADRAKIRFEARKARLEKERIAREEKHKQAAAARKAKMAENSAKSENEKSAVAAALARVKAKKSEKAVEASSNEKREVNDAIARVKARKAAKQRSAENQTPPDEQTTSDAAKIPDISLEADTATNKLAAAKARALAKAKAKKTQQSSEQDRKESNEDKVTAAKARAIAKAKAKKSKDGASSETKPDEFKDGESGTVTLENNKIESKEDKIAAAKARAIAKAKARKSKDSAPNETKPDETNDDESGSVSLENNKVESKEDKIAAAKARAIAKAKAKKESNQVVIEQTSEDYSETDELKPSKKEKIAEAIAKHTISKGEEPASEPKVIENKKEAIKERIKSLENVSNTEKTQDDHKTNEKADKKARIAAAIAKAKAKKEAKENN